MIMRFKQRMFSWFDSYDIYDEAGNTLYTVEGQFSWGHCLHILDAQGTHVGTVQERVLTLLPRFELYIHDQYIGCLTKELTFLKPRFTLEGSDWTVEGAVMEWDYTIQSPRLGQIASISKELFNWTDTYTIDVANPIDALMALMVVLSIDAEKCGR